ncbi:La protein 1-like protein [Drosera capensis]
MTTSLGEETSKKVIRQVEFYFSDSNLPRDYFLRKTIGESEDGCMVEFYFSDSNLPRDYFLRKTIGESEDGCMMRGHLSLGEAKPEDISEETLMAVANTLRTSGFLKVSEDGNSLSVANNRNKIAYILPSLSPIHDGISWWWLKILKLLLQMIS